MQQRPPIISHVSFLPVYQKMLYDLNEREHNRTVREIAILKELSLINKIGNQTFRQVDKMFRKMLRKIFSLISP